MRASVIRVSQAADNLNLSQFSFNSAPVNSEVLIKFLAGQLLQAFGRSAALFACKLSFAVQSC
jgi:hypothetical protein